MTSSDDLPHESWPSPTANGPVSSQLSVGDAVSYGWQRFKANAGTWIGVAVIAVLIQILLNVLFGPQSVYRMDAARESAWTFGVVLGSIVTTVVGYLINAAMVRGALHEVDGQRPSIGSFFQFTNVGNVILASILVGLLGAIGLLLFVIPGVIVIFLSWWTLQFVIDRDESAITGIGSSFRAISSQAGRVLLLALALFGINVLGAIPFGLGLLVTLPLTMIASTYAYRVVSGGGVAA